MRHVLHIAAIITLGIVGTGVGCASTVHVDTWDDSGDQGSISQARTWAFLNHDPPIQFPADEASPEFTYRVTSPARDAQRLDADLAHCIEQALSVRGYERVETDADLYVDYDLTLQPRIETVEVPIGQRFVPSLSYSPSYIIDGLEIAERAFEAVRLEINFRERRGRILWRGELVRELGAGDRLALERDVDELIGRLPATRVR
ncbi:MAG: DUF4136 domain-containing protein [Deltaproteobacteria bacterium]|nr:DUF4136 domain-containing protein [Deltaproteobacteria bacterium]MBW2723194.1 DUF4136 domain-containing protein [Deltaproteobacteria bacterium]